MKNEFDERIQKNNAYYARFADKVVERTENRNFEYAFKEFLDGIDASGLVVDIGSGAGLHLKYFKDYGLKAIGVEPSAEMRQLATTSGVESIDGTFETLDRLPLKNVSGIWCAASLLHVPKEDLRSTLLKIRNLLNSNGHFYLTLRLGTGAKWDKWDEAGGDAERFIQLFTEEEILVGLKEAHFILKKSWIEDSYWGRPCKWMSAVAIKP